MRILGIDPGLSATGYGIIENGLATEFGLITTDTRQPTPERLRSLGEGMEEVVRRNRPTHCAIETLFFKTKGARSVILSAEARGTILHVLGRNRIPVTELTPATIKLAVTGSGRASKHQMNYMVKRLLQLGERVSEHAADALAAAYCLSRRLPRPGGEGDAKGKGEVAKCEQGRQDAKGKGEMAKGKGGSRDWRTAGQDC